MTVNPVVAIVAMGCLLIAFLVIAFRADRKDLPRIFEIFTRWFK